MPFKGEQTLDPMVRKGCNALKRRHQAFVVALKAIDQTPHIRRRPGGMAGLFRIIVEQQISVPSAQAILARCQQKFPDLSSATLVKATQKEMRECGLSRPKIAYVKAIAEAELEGRFNFNLLATMDLDQAQDYLCRLKGVGPWSAAIYLLFCDGRLDLWPPKDIALLAAWTRAADLPERPLMKDFDAMGETFAPYRGVAAHILWTYYAKIRGRAPI